ncbi:MAG TPA: hypothetical protein VN641_16585 [Urbifossiella sp.]|nr:hypothetical protein [Urbifossiella sp.]
MNGTIRLDGNPSLPDGARVRVELEDADAFDELPAEPMQETYEQHLAILRESIEEARTGQTRPARVVMQELAVKYGLAPEARD